MTHAYALLTYLHAMSEQELVAEITRAHRQALAFVLLIATVCFLISAAVSWHLVVRVPSIAENAPTIARLNAEHAAKVAEMKRGEHE